MARLLHSFRPDLISIALSNNQPQNPFQYTLYGIHIITLFTNALGICFNWFNYCRPSRRAFVHNSNDITARSGAMLVLLLLMMLEDSLVVVMVLLLLLLDAGVVVLLLWNRCVMSGRHFKAFTAARERPLECYVIRIGRNTTRNDYRFLQGSTND